MPQEYHKPPVREQQFNLPTELDRNYQSVPQNHRRAPPPRDNYSYNQQAPRGYNSRPVANNQRFPNIVHDDYESFENNQDDGRSRLLFGNFM